MPPNKGGNQSDLSSELNRQWKTWQETQANIYKPWMDFWGQAFSGWQGQGIRGPQEAVSEGQQPYNRWLDYIQEMMSKFGFPTEGLGPEIFQRLFESAGVLNKLGSLLADLYQTFNKVAREGGQYSFDAMSGELDAWSDEYRKLIEEVIAPIFPEQLRWMPELYSGEIPLMYTGLTMHLWAPWLDFTRRLADKQAKGELLAPQSTIKVYEEWRTAWEDSFGRVLRAPAMGYYREAVEKLSRSVNSYTEFNIMLAEFYASIEGAAMQALRAMQERLAQLQAERDAEPLSFRDIYSLWWQTNEQVYEELFKTDEFSRLLGQVVDRGMQFRTDFQSYMEEITKELPFPNRSEMDHLYKTVYQLKRDVRRLSRELAELKGEPAGHGSKEPAKPGKPGVLRGVN